MFPVMLDLRGRPCLVVGAGPIAHRKLQQLLTEGARVTVVAPTAIEPVAQLAAAGDITLHARPFVDSDLDGCALAMVATGVRAVDEQVKRAAQTRGILVNVADVPDLCDFHLPATIRRGDLQLCIASGGGAPFAVRRLRELFEGRIGPGWSEWLAAAKEFRRRIQALGLSGTAADACYDRFFAGTVDEQAFSVRVPNEQEVTAWSTSPDQPTPAENRIGHVTLVGAGPGSPGLLTVEGARRLRHADAVVYDRLAIPAIPLDLPDSVELHSVGKEAGNHPVPQDEINALLVRLARQGKRVVRLKGGDPFVFARGGEEVRTLRKEEIPCEVIPGVTAGIAVPAAAGIPVTYRGEAVRLTFVTAHEGGAPQMRWDLLAKDAHATLVGYMGVSTLADVSAALLTAGMDPATPGAVIEQGTLARQRSVRAPVAELAKVAAQAGLRPPAIFVIGRVVARAEELASPPRPLQGARIGAFAPDSLWSRVLREAGAEVLLAPIHLTRAARLVVGHAPLSGWLVRTEYELDAIESERTKTAAFSRCTLWCLGAELAAQARGRGWPQVSEISSPPAPAQFARGLNRAE
jgi:uroporphyrin-III C-methyltransferase / precorrin-2 dehydrogenase / sirohydrochlorin ferrochelatase